MASKYASRSMASSSNGTAGRRRSLLPSMTWKQSSDLEIILDGKDEFIHSYSTFDAITGHVKIRFEKTTCIDDFSITFQGQAATWVEKVASVSPTMGRTTGKHTFLKVEQPIDQTFLPEHGRALAGVTYTVPFKFVVPDRILDFTCNHRVEKEAMRLNHLLLPPSIGDPMLSGSGMVLMNDLAPDMARISYVIRVGLFKASPNARKPEYTSESKGVRIIPAREDLPPIMLNPKPIDGTTKYRLRKEKNVRKGIFKIGKKQGCIVAESSQPSSLKLPHPSQPADEAPMTISVVKLRFDPTSVDEYPPSLNNITSKLRVYTFYGAAPWTYVPAPDSYDTWSTVHSQYPECVDLSTLDLTNVEWVKHEPALCGSTSQRGSVVMSRNDTEDLQKNSVTTQVLERSYSNSNSAHSPISRRASYLSTASASDADSISTPAPSSVASSAASTHGDSSICSPSSSHNSLLPFYTASITVPITLPFHSTSLSPSTPASISPVSRRNSSIISSSSTASASSAMPRSSRKSAIAFLPTFHSCLVSRVYSLDLTVSSQSTLNLNLRVPIQMTLPYTSIPVDETLPDYSDFVSIHSQPPPLLASGTQPQSESQHHNTTITASNTSTEAQLNFEDEDESLAHTLQTRLDNDRTRSQHLQMFLEEANQPPPPTSPPPSTSNQDLPPEYTTYNTGTIPSQSRPSPFRAFRNMPLPSPSSHLSFPSSSSSTTRTNTSTSMGVNTRRPPGSLAMGHWHLL